MNEKNISAIAESQEGFKFHFFIEKAAIADETENDFAVIGIASTPNVDHDSERMSEPALKRMVEIINQKSVPLRVEHQKGDGAVVGDVNEAWLDDRNNMWIKAPLKKDNPAATMLHNALKSGAKLGLSVGGRVKRAYREIADGLGKMIRTFYDVELDEVSVTPRPSNFDAWLLAKHYVGENEETFKFYNTKIYETYLAENPKLDYMSAFEKSIPVDAWKKVEPETNNKMKKNTEEVIDTEETEKEEVVDETVESTEKEDSIETEESIGEIDETVKSYIDKKFSSIESLIKSSFKKMTDDGTAEREVTPEAEPEETPALDQREPEKEKTEVPGNVKLNVQIGKDIKKEGADGDTEATREETGETEATISEKMRKFAKKLTDRFTKAMEDYATSLSETATEEGVAEDTEKQSEDEFVTTKEGEEESVDTAETDTEKEESEYDETEKESSGSSEEYDTSDYDLEDFQATMKSRGVKDIDGLAAVVAEMYERIEDRFAKSGKRVVGLEKMISDFICNDAEIQKNIRDMMKQPGPKKSVITGAPYVFLKSGHRMKLVPDSAYVQKSVNPNSSFGDVYKEYFSSQRD